MRDVDSNYSRGGSRLKLASLQRATQDFPAFILMMARNHLTVVYGTGSTGKPIYFMKDSTGIYSYTMLEDDFNISKSIAYDVQDKLKSLPFTSDNDLLSFISSKLSLAMSGRPTL